MTSFAYQAILDDIYVTFMRVKHLNKGRFDRDARQPQRLLAIARQLGILPPPDRTIKISGSKGKGTTARIASRLLQNQLPSAKIGLFVSPEEDDHNDRMRINGVAMSRDEFVCHYWRLKPHLLTAEAELTGPHYLSPLGIFLLIALEWFHAEGVDYYVLETGRGVAHDEVGQISSKAGLLTSIMLEHADKLGPTLGDIIKDKLSLCDTSDVVVTTPQVAATANSRPNLRTIESRVISHNNLPKWLNLNNDLALAGISHLIGSKVPLTPLTDWRDVSASFGLRKIKSHIYVFEGLIHTDSLDRPMLDGWQHECCTSQKSTLPREVGGTYSQRHHQPPPPHPGPPPQGGKGGDPRVSSSDNGSPDRLAGITTNVIASFPDDKDREQLLAAFDARGWPITECLLTGTRGYLDYARAEADSSGNRVTFAFDDAAGFAGWLATRPAATAPGRTYLVGTQTYIRLVRKALALMAEPGGHHAQP